MPGTSYTRSEARTQIQRLMLDPTGKYFTTDICDDAINDAMEQWCQDTRMRVANAQIDIVSNQPVYSLTGVTPRVIEVLRASCPTGSTATDDAPLRVMTQTQMDDPEIGYPGWREHAASWPVAVIRDLQGPQSLRLYPTPESSQAATVRDGTIFLSATTGAVVDISDMTISAATALVGATIDIQFLCGSLQLYYVAGSTDISSDATTLETACGISPDFQDAVIFYACARLCEMSTPISQLEKAATYWGKYGAIVAKASQREADGMQVRPPKTVRGRRF